MINCMEHVMAMKSWIRLAPSRVLSLLWLSSKFDAVYKFLVLLTNLLVHSVCEVLKRICLLVGYRCLRLRDWLPYRKTTDTSICMILVVCGMADRLRWARYDCLFTSYYHHFTPTAVWYRFIIACMIFLSFVIYQHFGWVIVIYSK